MVGYSYNPSMLWREGTRTMSLGPAWTISVDHLPKPAFRNNKGEAWWLLLTLNLDLHTLHMSLPEPKFVLQMVNYKWWDLIF